jgi:mannosyl-glycoprotein endo-beta-N-acetylglucosaminidase
MAGGYVEDHNIQGHTPIANDNAYCYTHWSAIDIFIYFSHSRVTIPPPMWIDAAHTNNTLILGTYITEWQDGVSDNCKLHHCTHQHSWYSICMCMMFIDHDLI